MNSPTRIDILRKGEDDLGLAYYVSDTLYIMENGETVERGEVSEVIINPQHPYTKRLVSDVPKLREEWDLELA